MNLQKLSQCLFGFFVLMTGSILAAEEVSFSRDVLPILSDRCFYCHGPDTTHREADLRLDLEKEAFADRDGFPVIVRGHPEKSPMIQRVMESDPDLRMPPVDSNRKPLSEREKALLKQWVAAGAPWGRHWSFEPPVKPFLDAQGPHPIDALVQKKLAQAGRHLADPASRTTLARRVSFDLTGLPPTSEELAVFLADQSPQAWTRFVDRLLNSPHYGERLAMWWLDAARYSDTDGFQQDALRENWPWRDWVVNAFNSNQPFDQFTIEQFAGDLLPTPAPEQILATCFHRNHMTNGEGGRDPEESRIDYVIDRVNTTGTVWLGLTLGCAQCHTHKFDPISHEEYYRLFAFFNNIDEDGKAGKNAKPYLKFRSPDVDGPLAEAQSLVDARNARLDATRERAQAEFEPWLQERLAAVKQGFHPWQPWKAALRSVEGTVLTQSADAIVQSSGPNPRQDDYQLIGHPELSRITALQLEIFPHASHTGGKLSRGPSGEFILTDVKLQVRRRGESQLRDIELVSALADVEKKAAASRAYGLVSGTLDDDPRNGWTTESHSPTQAHRAVFVLAAPLQLAPNEELIFVLLQRSTEGNANIGRFRVSLTDQSRTALQTLAPMPLEELAATSAWAPDQLEAPLRARLFEQFLDDHALFQSAKADYEQAVRQRDEFQKAAGEMNVMVLAERKEPRKTYILKRGVWDQKGSEVTPGIVEAIFPLKTESAPNRLDLARWLVSRKNPLTARVIVNQLWQLCFGAGLVRTPEDFGLQGEVPTHPELLDWLAVEFMEHNWDVKHLLHVIVTSKTYQQSSVISPEALEWDPDNRWLARGARFRLPSWMIRDGALHASGLLNPALGGPPTRPYQADGIWEEMFMGRLTYEPSQGALQFRRTLYAFWRRSAAPAFLFDNAQRRVCETRPRLTNTPLQALILLNDFSLLESCRALAQKAIHEESDSSRRIRFLFKAILSRSPTEAEMTVLHRELTQARNIYASAPDLARTLLDFGQKELCVHENEPELAACFVVASMIFNLDEALTHE